MDNYAVIYLFSIANHPLAKLKEKAKEFTESKQSKELGRRAKVVNDPEVVSAFEYFIKQEKFLSKKLRSLSNAVANMSDALDIYRAIRMVD